MENNNNIGSFFPFIMIILVFVISNFKKKMAQKEKEKARERKISRVEPAYRSASPPVKLSEVLMVKKKEGLASSIPEKKIQVVRNKKPRIQKVVGRLHSKKDLILISEILNHRCF